MIGVGTLLIGHLFLLIFGLAVPWIQLGGGILICKTAIELLGDSNPSDKGPARMWTASSGRASNRRYFILSRFLSVSVRAVYP